MATKYITFQFFDLDIEDIVIFSELQVHKDIAYSMRHAHAHPVSAGFIQLTKDGPVCSGRSESLNLDSRPEEDTKLARRLFNIH